MRANNGGFDQGVFRIIQPFDGPLAIVAAHGDHLNAPEKSPLHMLVPVNGTEVSRRAAEVAITAARVVGAPITALYVSNVRPDARGRRSRRMRTPPHEQAILKEIVELADQYDLKIKTAVRAGITPDDAILMEIKRNKHDLIVLGVSRRPGEKLFFGDTATAVFEKAPASILIVTT